MTKLKYEGKEYSCWSILRVRDNASISEINNGFHFVSRNCPKDSSYHKLLCDAYYIAIAEAEKISNY